MDDKEAEELKGRVMYLEKVVDSHDNVIQEVKSNIVDLVSELRVTNANVGNLAEVMKAEVDEGKEERKQLTATLKAISDNQIRNQPTIDSIKSFKGAFWGVAVTVIGGLILLQFQ